MSMITMHENVRKITEVRPKPDPRSRNKTANYTYINIYVGRNQTGLKEHIET